MKGPGKEAMAKTIDAFVDTSDLDLPLVDRSTAENWSCCPWMAKECEEGRGGPVGLAAEVGEAIHQCLSTTTQAWIDSNGAHSTTDLRNDLEFELRRARPDLQPEALRSMMPSAWAWSKFLADIHPGNILRFDGGEDHRSGQLAYDVPDLGARVTSELDLLYASPSPELVEEVDYKTGHKQHWVSDVADSFQFQLHALLIFHNYPNVNGARIRAWDTRLNRITYGITFSRNRLADYEFRIRSALEIRRRQWDKPETWPVSEKCAICQVAARCPVADEPLHDLASDPSGYLKKYIAVASRLASMQEAMAAHVDATKQEIVCGPIRFGRNKPKSEKKSPATMYELKGKSNGDSDPD